METVVMCLYGCDCCDELCPMLERCWPEAEKKEVVANAEKAET